MEKIQLSFKNDINTPNDSDTPKLKISTILLFVAGIILFALGAVVVLNYVRKRKDADGGDNRD